MGSNSLAQQLVLRGLNIQYPFSQLILDRIKEFEARRYDLGHRQIAHAGEEMFLIETLEKEAHAALLGDVDLPPRPEHAQVVGAVVFERSVRYPNKAAWKRDRQKHRIRQGSSLDWSGKGPMYAWHVGRVRRFQQPVPAGVKSQTGWRIPRALQVIFAAADAQSASLTRVPLLQMRSPPPDLLVLSWHGC